MQETQAVAQLMPYLTGTDQQQKRAFVAIKVLGNTKLMVDLAASDPRAPGAREALRDVEFCGATQEDRNLAISVLAQFEFAPSCKLPFQNVALAHPIDFSDQSCGMSGDSPSNDLRLQNLAKNNFCAGSAFHDLSLGDFINLQQRPMRPSRVYSRPNCPAIGRRCAIWTTAWGKVRQCGSPATSRMPIMPTSATANLLTATPPVRRQMTYTSIS